MRSAGLVEEPLDVDHDAGHPTDGDEAPLVAGGHGERHPPPAHLLDGGLGARLVADGGGGQVVDPDLGADARSFEARRPSSAAMAASSHRAMMVGVDSTGTDPDRMAIAVSASVTTNSTLALSPTFTGTGLP